MSGDLDRFIEGQVSRLEPTIRASAVQRLLAEDVLDWDPDLHPRGPDGKFVSKEGLLGLDELLDELPDEVSEYLDDRDIDPRVPDDADFEDVTEAKADWQEARDNLGALVDQYGQEGSLGIIEALAKRRDKMRKVRKGEIGPGSDSSPNRPDPPEPTEALELEHISEQWDGDVPEDIPEDLGIAYAAADASEDYRQFRRTVTQQGMMDISNRELHRFGRAFARSEDEPLPDLQNMDDGQLQAIRGRDPATFQAIQEARDGDGQITMYRAVPEEAENIDVGDYVALNRDYVERHRENVLEGQQDTEAQILEEQVPIEDVAWQQGAADEFIYTPKAYREEFGTLEGFYQQAAGDQ